MPEKSGDHYESLIKHLLHINENVNRCDAIIENMLDFVRHDEMEMMDADLLSLLRDALSLVKSNARAKFRNFEFSSMPSISGNVDLDEIIFARRHAPPSSTGDWILKTRPQQLLQVLLNILLNAVDATDDGGHIDLHVERRQDGFELSVKDDGTGIPPEAKDHVFDPFFTTKPVGEGTGLGLYLSHQILATLGGRISLESEVGMGTTMSVWLPRQSVGAGDA
jgi:signal transduction histidine kinase